ncbi:hypothetical protein C3L33_00340, partial [Rhododendron williamsianum]
LMACLERKHCIIKAIVEVEIEAICLELLEITARLYIHQSYKWNVSFHLICLSNQWGLLLSSPVHAFTGTYGVNYGRIADNIPKPGNVALLLKANKIKNVRIYDADPEVLTAFKGSGIEIIVGLGNQYLKDISVSEDRAMDWVKENVQAFLPGTSIKGIAVGNEVLGSTDQELWEALLPAVKNVYNALDRLDLTKTVEVSSPHSEAVFQDSYPPSSYDAAYIALEKAGFGKMEVIISETGWASKGDANEVGATVNNAKTYNKNLRKLLAKKKGTPYKPKIAIRAYIFAMFNENLKPGPTSERNFGLFKADGSTAYDIGFDGLEPSSAVSSLLSLKV